MFRTAPGPLAFPTLALDYLLVLHLLYFQKRRFPPYFAIHQEMTAVIVSLEEFEGGQRTHSVEVVLKEQILIVFF